MHNTFTYRAHASVHEGNLHSNSEKCLNIKSLSHQPTREICSSGSSRRNTYSAKELLPSRSNRENIPSHEAALRKLKAGNFDESEVSVLEVLAEKRSAPVSDAVSCLATILYRNESSARKFIRAGKRVA